MYKVKRKIEDVKEIIRISSCEPQEILVNIGSFNLEYWQDMVDVKHYRCVFIFDKPPLVQLTSLTVYPHLFAR